jgi:hypothetical protein
LALDCAANERGEEEKEEVVGRRRFELLTPAMSRLLVILQQLSEATTAAGLRSLNL